MMGLFWRTKAKKDPGIFALAASGLYRTGENTFDRNRAAYYLTFYGGWVYVCVNHIANAVASRPLRVYMPGREGKPVGEKRRKAMVSHAGEVARKAIEGEESIVEVPDHPLAKLIGSPSPHTTGYEFLFQTQAYLELTGIAPWYVDRMSGEPVVMEVLSPQYFHVVSEGGIVSGYRYGADDARKPLSLDEVVYVYDRDPMYPMRGKGRVEACLSTAKLAKAMEVFKESYIERGAQPGLIVTAKGAKHADELKRARDEFDRLYGGPAKAGRTMFFGGDTVVTPWMGDKELPYVLSEPEVRDKIAGIFGVPKAFLTTEDVNLANGTVAAPHFQLLTVSPKCRKLEDRINADIASAYDDGVFVAFDPPLGEDEDAAAREVRDNWSAGVLTRNEARMAMGYPAVRGADEFSDSMRGAGAGLLGGGPSGGAMVPLLGERVTLSVVRASHVKHVGEHAAKGDVTNWDAIDRVGRALARSLGGVFGAAEVGPGGLLSAQAFELAIARTMLAELEDVFRMGLDRATADVGDPFNLRPDQALARLNEYTIRFASNARQRYEVVIRQAISDGVEAGENQQQINERVQAAQRGMSEFDAERIARTEASRAYMGGRQVGWEQSGSVVGKRWILSRDPCELCQAIYDRVKDGVGLADSFGRLGETIVGASGTRFQLDYADIPTPPVHPQCRCSMAPILRSDSQ